ncbi:MAG: hypothetical protein JWO72_2066 [Caulobacteraceae bacterium]|nr:hypothetical protein [Caulobacteraceae bacterium]
MTMTQTTPCIAFEGSRQIAAGPLSYVAAMVKQAAERGGEPVLVYDAQTAHPVEIDLRGTVAQVLERIPAGEGPLEETPARRGPGRPRLGVVAREVTLLPRQWEWLGGQPGGASVALRRLVDEARKASGGRDEKRARQEAAYRFMTALAGNETHYEEATRALFAGDAGRFEAATADWPQDVRIQAERFAAKAFG